MDAIDTTAERLKGEITVGLSKATASMPKSKDDIRKVLAARRAERLKERYSELVIAERPFMEVVDIPIDWKNIDPVLRWAETTQERRIWNYARNIVSSAPDDGIIGRQGRYYFLDANTGRWLGMVCMASPMLTTIQRAQRLQWRKEARLEHLNNILNIAICVPIQPFGTLLGGKLLAASALSNEVRVWYRRKYSDHLLAVETTSLFGKGSQYNRIHELEYLGLTTGHGNTHISADLWSKIQAWASLHPGMISTSDSHSKGTTIDSVASHLGLKSSKVRSHGHQRGYYWGITAENSEAILRGDESGPAKFYDRPLEDLAAFWRKRWYEMRLPKKRQEAEAFDPSIYLLDNNVPPEDQGARQAWLF